MLKQRIITALLLLAVLLPAVFYPAGEVFAIVAVILIAAGAWEWARMNQCDQTGSLVAGAVCAVMCLMSWYSGLLYAPLKVLWIVAGGGWVILG
ncbi:MAG: phosphatidate cytidylyltransferase, partial [Rhodoferax sp.]